MDSKGALAELKAFQGSRKGAGDYYKESQAELGVGDAQTRANDLRGLIRSTEESLKGVGASVAGRTRGFGVTEAQRARLQNLESQPIAERLGGLQGSFSDAQQNYRDLLGQAGTRAGMAYQTDTDRQNALQTQYQNLFQGEQAAAEQAFRERQLAEQARQFQMDLDERRRSSAAQAQAIRDQYAQQASLYNQQREDAKAAQDAAAADAARQKALQDQAVRDYRYEQAKKTSADVNKQAAYDITKASAVRRNPLQMLNPYWMFNIGRPS